MSSDGVAVLLREVLHALAFREVLADQPVGVFVGPTFPRMMGCGEVEARARALFDGGVVMELGAVVRRDRPDGSWLTANELRCASGHVGGGAGRQLPDRHVPGLAGQVPICV